MPSKKQKTPLISGKYYHIYNRGNNREKLFYDDQDYQYFMNKYKLLISPYVQTYAYCLLPNHFHFLIYLKEEPEIPNVNVSNQLRKLFITYARRINILQNRTGGLFTKSFQRIEVKDIFYLKNLVVYIHRNPINHGILFDFQNYNYSSFSAIVNAKRTILSTNEIISWFGDSEEFLRNHFINNNQFPQSDVHYLEGDGVPHQEIESL